jgi:hypothetical protein
MKTVIIYASIVSVLATVASAQNENITWNTPLTISGASDVSTLGTYYGSWTPYAYNSPEVVNGVTLGSDLPGKTQTFDNAGGTGTFNSPGTSDANYNDLLTSALFGNSAGPYSVSWNGMTLGDTYQVEFWVNDARNSITAERSETITGGSSTSAPLFYGSGSTGPGDYIIGTFVADASGSETITMNGLPGADISASPQMNMILVRDITPAPEPSSFALLAIGTGAMLFGFRRKNLAV